MVDIKVDWVSEFRSGGDDYGVVRGSDLVYQIRYDLPGLDFMSDHVHTIPLQAVADHMMTLNLPNPEDALEFCILDRVAMNYLEDQVQEVQPGARVVSMREEDHPLYRVRQLDESKRKVWQGTSEALMQVCTTMQTSDPDDMLDQMFNMIDPCACAEAKKPYILPDITPPKDQTASSLMVNVRDGQKTCRARCGTHMQGHNLDKDVRGWKDCVEVLGERWQALETERFNVYDIRYGESLRQVAAQRCERG